MVLSVQHIAGQYRIVLPPEAIAVLHLTAGAQVDVIPMKDQTEVHYASCEAVIKAFDDTESAPRES